MKLVFIPIFPAWVLSVSYRGHCSVARIISLTTTDPCTNIGQGKPRDPFPHASYVDLLLSVRGCRSVIWFILWNIGGAIPVLIPHRKGFKGQAELPQLQTCTDQCVTVPKTSDEHGCLVRADWERPAAKLMRCFG